MNHADIPMVSGRKSALPKVYGDTPTFLGVPRLDLNHLPSGLDAIVVGVPWEGTVTWGTFTGCELAPRSIRHCAARYGGFLPEYEIDLFDHLSLGDAGDIAVEPNSAEETMARVCRAMERIYTAGTIPVVMGGDHSFTPEIIQAMTRCRQGRIGVIHFDAHFDNAKVFGEDTMPRCAPIHRIAQIPQVRTQSIAHVAIRGPRNSPSQLAYAREMGAHVFTIRDIRKRGMDTVIEEAIGVARAETEQIYVTICSDCIDAAFNPGGPADFNGLFAHELFAALYRLGQNGIAGLDFVEIYPNQDASGFSSHLAAWAIIHALAGLADRKRSVKGETVRKPQPLAGKEA
ncbi:MAG: agmatinase family protein [Deltaproteobacteria bacterium]|nr:agmatinase family protein [Deltaproteobacteria bacterium]